VAAWEATARSLTGTVESWCAVTHWVSASMHMRAWFIWRREAGGEWEEEEGRRPPLPPV
jgi:hypothetical protein